jgi:hypothetical protein
MVKDPIHKLDQLPPTTNRERNQDQQEATNQLVHTFKGLPYLVAIKHPPRLSAVARR